jgi:hypothetical protein
MNYHAFTSQGRVEGTSLLIDEALLDADRVCVAITGITDYKARTVRANVIVAPIKFLNVIIRRIPVLNRVFSNKLFAIPVQVSGPLDQLRIVPLAPGAVATRLTSIIGNFLRLPLELVSAAPSPSAPAAPAAP